MKNKKAATMPFKHLRPAILTEKRLISIEPQLINLTPEERAKLIEFVYELSLVLYNHYTNSQNFKVGEA